jgi:taspase, threonine aspartase, 1
MAMALLKNGGSALDAVELAIKVFEDREITNAGYGSNLCMDGTVECDALIVDHYGRSGAAGAVSSMTCSFSFRYQIWQFTEVKNPIGLARLILDESTRPLSLQRVPPNLLVGQGATDFADEKGLLIVFNDYMVSKGAKDRWNRWRKDLDLVEEQDKQSREQNRMRNSSLYSDQELANHAPTNSPSDFSPPVSPSSIRSASAFPRISSPNRPLVVSTADIPDTYLDAHTNNHARYLAVPGSSLSDPLRNGDVDRNPNIDGNRPTEAFDIATDDDHLWTSKRRRLSGSNDGSFDDSKSPLGKVAVIGSTRSHRPLASAPTPKLPSRKRQGDRIIDTVGAIAVDCFGNIAAGSSSGGIGMKHRGRCGPAALVGVGTAVIPADPEDPDETSVATVTSGTGEHMATTQAATTCADRVYSSVRKARGGELESCTEDQAIYSVIDKEFMGHPGVKNSHCAGAIGILAVKKTRHGIMLYFGHNTDSFALASMQSGDRKPSCVMSRSKGCGSIAQGGRVAKYRGNGSRHWYLVKKERRMNYLKSPICIIMS